MEFKTKEQYVAHFLREGIIAGRFARGMRLKQTEIAQQLDISVTPVREAFQILQAEGYLVSERHRGVVVASYDADSVSEITDLRVVLECRLVGAAVERTTATDLSKLQQLEEAFEEAIRQSDREQIRAANYRFHSYLYNLAKLPQTLHFVQILWAKYPFDLIHVISGRPQRTSKEHGVLLQALAAADKEAAIAATREHIESGRRELVESPGQ